MSQALGAGAGFLLDRLLGEPPPVAHPVAWFGRAMWAAEGRMWGDDRASGVLFTAVGVLPVVGVGLTLRRFLGAGPSTALAAMLSIAGRMLNRTTIDVSNGHRAPRATRHRRVTGDCRHPPSRGAGHPQFGAGRRVDRRRRRAAALRTISATTGRDSEQGRRRRSALRSP